MGKKKVAGRDFILAPRVHQFATIANGKAWSGNSIGPCRHQRKGFWLVNGCGNRDQDITKGSEGSNGLVAQTAGKTMEPPCESGAMCSIQS